MARGLKWSISFKSLGGYTCNVNIYVEGFSGDVTQLTASSNPFVFDEDDTDNLLNVVRVKTGFLRVIEENYGDLIDMHPQTNTSHYITVTYNLTTVFSGFLQAQSFESKWIPCPRVLEFPVMSPLGTLGGKYMPVPNAPSYITLAEALKNAVEAMDSNITNVVFPDYMISTTIRTLSYRINTLNYCPFNPDYSVVATDTKPLYKPNTIMQFIEDICNCFGLIVHDMPGTLVFVKYDYEGTYNQYVVNTMASSNPSYTAITSGATEQNLSGLPVKSDENTESNILPLSKIVVNYDDEYFPDYEIPFNHTKARYSHIGEVILEPSTDEITSDYLLTNAMPTLGTTGVTVGAFGPLDAFAALEEGIVFSVPRTASASTKIFKWKLYQVPKYFGYGCVLTLKMAIINRTTHEIKDSAEGQKVGIIMKNGSYYRQANGTWSVTSGEYIDIQETDENGNVVIEYHQSMPDIGTPLEVIICAEDFRSNETLGFVKDVKFSRAEITFFQYEGRTLKNDYTIEDANGSPSDGATSQNITTARPSEGMVVAPSGATAISYGTIMTNYAYMFLTQHRFVLDTYVLPNVMHYLKKTIIGNSIKKRIVGISFDIWNDIVRLTAQGSTTLNT